MIVTVVPALFILAGLGMMAEAILYTTQAGSARGEVVDVSRHYGDGNAVSYLPTIRYRRDDGLFIKAETHMSSSSYDYEIGAQVDILYSYDNPEKVRINSFFSLYGPGLILTVVGALFIRIITWVRGKVGRGAVLGRVADALADHMQDAAQDQGAGKQPGREADPWATDPARPGHVHKPKPKRQPVVRRMR